MTKEVLVIPARREYYRIEDVKGMTVGELIDRLKNYDRNAIVALSHDGDYIFGGIESMRLRTIKTND